MQTNRRRLPRPAAVPATPLNILDLYAIGLPAACVLGAFLALVLEWLR